MNMKNEIFWVTLGMALMTVAADTVPSAPKDVVKDAPPKIATAIPAAAELGQKAEDEIDPEADDSAEAAKKKATVKFATPPPVETAVLPPPSAAASVPAARLALPVEEVDGALVDITCEDATLADVIRQFRKTTGANIISADSTNLQHRVSVTLNHVPWLEALKSILNAQNFRLEDRNGIYYVSEDKRIEPVFTRTFALNHASAKELAELFNSTLGDPKKRDPKTGKNQPIATAFEGANVVVVTASDKALADCETIIKSVDKAIPQIYIEARFIEVSNEALHKLGMQWNQLESWGATAHGLNAGWESNSGRMARFKAGQETLFNDVSGTDAKGSTVSGQVPSGYTKQSYVVPDKINNALGAGRSGEDMSWANARGFSGQLSADDFRLALSAFESMSDVKIFSNPKIIVSNGKEAKVDMTTKFPHIKVTSQRNNTGNESYVDMATEMQAIPGEDKMMFAKEAFFSWGITLDVKPRISPDGLISVEIIPTISQLDKDVTASGFYEIKSDAGSGLYPVIQVKRLTTDFTMKDGATAVIGGLSKTTEEDIDSGIPYLRKIPYIGPKLFGWKSRGKVQKEIIVFVTLGIADPADLPADVGLPKNAVTGREFVEGRKLEPGDREGGVASLMAFDTRPIEEQRKDNNLAPGTVTITPVKKVVPRPAPVVKPTEEEVNVESAAGTADAKPTSVLQDLDRTEKK